MENVSPESIQSQGGKARAEKLSADKIKAIASKGALMRWGAKATHKGNFQEKFGIDVDCYVLGDASKTAVISQTGLARALGLVPRSNTVPRLLGTKAMLEVGGAELIHQLAQPIKFQWGTGGAEQPPSTIHGFDVAVLIDVCRAIVAAGSSLGEKSKDLVAQASIILNASAKSGIRNLVYALAGYNPTAEEVIAAFKAYVQDEAKKYEKEFPPELYSEWYRLYQIPVYDAGRGRPWHFKKLTVDHVYYPLAKSNGKILQLIRASKATGGDRRNKLFQFLNDIGTRALRFHLGRLVEIAVDSTTREQYEAKVRKRFGGEEQTEFSLVPPEPITPASSSTSLP